MHREGSVITAETATAFPLGALRAVPDASWGYLLSNRTLIDPQIIRRQSSDLGALSMLSVIQLIVDIGKLVRMAAHEIGRYPTRQPSRGALHVGLLQYAALAFIPCLDSLLIDPHLAGSRRIIAHFEFPRFAGVGVPELLQRRYAVNRRYIQRIANITPAKMAVKATPVLIATSLAGSVALVPSLISIASQKSIMRQNILENPENV